MLCTVRSVESTAKPSGRNLFELLDETTCVKDAFKDFTCLESHGGA